MSRSFLKGLFKFSPRGWTWRSLTKSMFSDKHLLKTNVTLSLVLSVTADSVVQRIARSTERIDKSRVARMGWIGLEFGFIGHFWYRYLDRRFVGASTRIVLKKVLIDQLIFSPIYILVFFVSLALMEGNSPTAAASEISKKGPKLYLLDWLIWPPAQFINFRFLPLRFRVLFDICLSFLVDLIYSHVRFEQS